MNDFNWLGPATLILLAIVGGALVGWALRSKTPSYLEWRAGYFAGARDAYDNPDPGDSAGA